MKKILVVDGNSILNRAFYGIRPLSTKSGQPTNAIYGFVNILSKHLSAINPDFAAVAFDLHAPTFRKKMYDAYKAGRRETPEDLLVQFDGAKECVHALGMQVLTLEGYEADDILGTVSEYANRLEDTEAYILSGDRDLLQLISDNVTVLLATNNETVEFHREQFMQKYTIAPEQFVDLKALMGDSSDNIPGARGVGEKTAIKLICEFGSVDGVYDNLDKHAASLASRLAESRDNVYLSQELARIVRDAPVAESLDELEYRGYDNDALYSVLAKFELYAVIKKLGLTQPTAAPQPTDSTPSAELNREYVSADAAAVIAEVGDSIEIEISDRIYITSEGKNYAFDGRISELAPLLDGSRRVTAYDAKALYHTMMREGITPTAPMGDVMLSAYVLNSKNAQRSLSSLAFSYLGEAESEGSPRSYAIAPLDKLIRQALEDEGSLSLLDSVELPLALVLAKMEHSGFKVDIDGLQSFGDRLLAHVHELESDIYGLAGESFNINSPKQLGDILFDKLCLPHGKKTQKGYSTSAEVLDMIKNEHPIVGKILDYRQYTKLYSTYVVGLTRAVDDNDRIHTDFKQALTATGRLSSAEPNLQNIPIRTPLGREMRRYFIADEGKVLVDADYSQIELRLLAAISGDENMIAAFKEGADIHTRTAASVFNIPEPFVDADLRKRAKAVNFGIVYGISAFSLASDLSISNSEAKEYIQSYFRSYPSIDTYLKNVIESATSDGYTKTLFERRRYIPELTSSNAVMRNFGKRVAMNSPIQGTAADIMKIAMVRVSDRLERELPTAKLIMQVHDELIVECLEADQELTARILREEMEGAVKLSVPLTADISTAKTWLN